MRSTLLLSLTALALAGASGAQAAKTPPPPPPVPFEAGPEVFQARLIADGDRNRVLNQMEIGARAFWAGDYATAKPALDDAILRISSVFAGDPNAANARKLWYDEGSKDFKGEPYERAMTFFYRGMIYLHDADYENARAAFRQGQLQDAFAEEDQARTDFALLMFAEAWASHVNGDGDLRDDAMKNLAQHRANFPGIGAKDDTLILAETGQAPRKLGDGLDHAFFVYRRGKPILENQAEIVRGGVVTPLYPMEDIYYQASTRGGRAIDQILAGKAKFKATTGGIGSVVADTSVAFSEQYGASNATLIAGGVAGVFLIVSSSSKPAADVRTWSSLPDTVHVMTMATGGKPPEMTARFLKDGVALEGEKPVRCAVDENRKTLCLVRAH